MPDPTPPPANPTPTPAPNPPALPSKKSFFLTILGLGLFLFVMVFVFLVVLLLQNGGNNPILGALGVEPSLFQGLLKTLVSVVFGLLGFLSFILFLIGIFRRMTSAAVETDKKKNSMILAAISGVLFVFFIFVWIMLYFYISQVQFTAEGAAVIVSNPENTINLTAPIDITFSAQLIEQLYQREGIISYAWDLDGDKKFDDGNGRDIQYRYEDRGNSDGRYRVAVKTILGNGKETITEKDVTIANVLPSIEIDYEPKELHVPLEVNFSASKSKDSDGSIISYDWDFNQDGSSESQGASAKWNFTEVGTQEITLSVTDNNGATAKKTITLELLKGKTLQAFITAKPGLTGETPFKITVDGSESFIDEKVQSYEWDFGDNSVPVSGRSLQHEYKNPGEYTLKLTIEGESGKRYESEKKVSVLKKRTAPIAVISVKNHTVTGDTLSGKAPVKLELSAQSSLDPDGKIIEYRWEYTGDNTPDTLGMEAQTSFSKEGKYQVALTVIDDDEQTGTAVLKVVVGAPGLSVDIIPSTNSGPVPLEISFDASASRAEKGKIISYTWDFGDKSQSIIGSSKQIHIFQEVGEYIVKVTVLTDLGERQTGETLIVVRDIELQADFLFNPKTPRAGEKVFFDASPSQGSISRYYFEFGDGSIARIVKPEHVFEKPGVYEVILEVYDRQNRISRKSEKISVE